MRGDVLAGRILGIVVFLAGVGLLVFVFSLTYSFFNAPAGQLQPVPSPGADVPATTQLGESALMLFARIGLLVVMTIIGSLLAGRGAQLYFAAAGSRRPPHEPTVE